MRTPRNDDLALDAHGADGPDTDGPVRSCILTRDRASPAALVRLAISPDGVVLPDVRAKAAGRGAWIGVNRATLEAAIANRRLRGALARAFKGATLSVPDDLTQRIEDALRRAALDRLGLEARAGNLQTGSDRIEQAARAGKLHALYHAADAGEDGMRRLAQAWRVGSGREGSALGGLALPLPRPILSLALGRENVVHLGLTDRAAAARASEALGRWLHFIGPEPQPGSRRAEASTETHAPCGTAPQGASAPGPTGAPDEHDPAACTHEEFE